MSRALYLYITHDLASARYLAGKVLVLYAGQLMETAPSQQVMADPLHPYTKLLLSAVPKPRSKVGKHRIEARGEIPTIINPKPGCRFANRCPAVIDRCRQLSQPLRSWSRPFGSVLPLRWCWSGFGRCSARHGVTVTTAGEPRDLGLSMAAEIAEQPAVYRRILTQGRPQIAEIAALVVRRRPRFVLFWFAVPLIMQPSMPSILSRRASAYRRAGVPFVQHRLRVAPSPERCTVDCD